jgi:hypothetical protein
LGVVAYLNFVRERLNSLVAIAQMIDLNFSYFPYAMQSYFYYLMRSVELELEPRASLLSILMNDLFSNLKLTDHEIYELIRIILNKWPDDEHALNQLKFLPQEILDNPTTYAQRAANLIAQDKVLAFKEFVIRGRFIESQLLFWQFPEIQMAKCLRELAREEQCITTYDYGWFLMKKKGESAQRHLLLADLTKSIFGRTDIPEPQTLEEVGDIIPARDGWRELEFFHVFSAAELEPENIELQEKLLSLYESVHDSFEIAETKALAHRVLAAKPESEIAHRVLKLLELKAE